MGNYTIIKISNRGTKTTRWTDIICCCFFLCLTQEHVPNFLIYLIINLSANGQEREATPTKVLYKSGVITNIFMLNLTIVPNLQINLY